MRTPHMKPPVSVGDRVRVTGILPDDPDPLTVGLEGIVDYVGQWQSRYTRQIGVRWDDGRTLMLLDGDPYIVVRRAGPARRTPEKNRGVQNEA